MHKTNGCFGEIGLVTNTCYTEQVRTYALLFCLAVFFVGCSNESLNGKASSVSGGLCANGPCSTSSPLINETLVFTDEASGESRSTRTDNSGRFIIHLKPGKYTVKTASPVGECRGYDPKQLTVVDQYAKISLSFYSRAENCT